MRNPISDEKGTIIVAVIVTIVFVSGIALGLMYWLWSESKQMAQQKSQTRALYYAEMGTQKALQRLQFESTGTAAYHMFVDTLSAGNVQTFTINADGNTKVQVTVKQTP